MSKPSRLNRLPVSMVLGGDECLSLHIQINSISNVSETRHEPTQ